MERGRLETIGTLKTDPLNKQESYCTKLSKTCNGAAPNVALPTKNEDCKKSTHLFTKHSAAQRSTVTSHTMSTRRNATQPPKKPQDILDLQNRRCTENKRNDEDETNLQKDGNKNHNVYRKKEKQPLDRRASGEGARHNNSRLRQGAKIPPYFPNGGVTKITSTSYLPSWQS